MQSAMICVTGRAQKHSENMCVGNSWRHTVIVDTKPVLSCVQVEAAKAALEEAENVAKQLAEAAARARGEVDAARANLKDTAPQMYEAKSLESQVRLMAC